GWFTQTDNDQSMVKSTAEVANLSQLLLRVYEINPKSYEFMTLNGESYARSPLPDLLDEVNWGLQYLLTIQQSNGSFPAGIRKLTQTGKGDFVMLPATPESTARGVMALSSAVKDFKSQDLSLSVKMVRAAEKGWRNLVSQKQEVSPELLLLASAGMMQV